MNIEDKKKKLYKVASTKNNRGALYQLLEEETPKSTLTKNELTIKQEVNLNRLANEFKTLGHEINKPNASKLVVADDLDLSHLPEEEKEKFEPSASHPEEKNYQIEHDGDVVKDDVIARFRVPRTQKTIAIDKRCTWRNTSILLSRKNKRWK